jgi:hypothetical protein
MALQQSLSALRRMGFLGFNLRFADQHHGNVITDWINAVAAFAFQPAAIRLQSDARFAGRTADDFQKIGTQIHQGTLPS